MCGDSTNEDDVARLADGATADLLVTDPPYNVAVEGGTEEKLTIMNDNMGERQFLEFLNAAFGAANSIMKAGCPFYIWYAQSESVNFIQAAQEKLGKVRQYLIWNKNNAVISRQDYNWKHEGCLYGWKDGAAHYFVDDHSNTTVIDEIEKKGISNMTKEELKKALKELMALDVPTTVINEDRPNRSEEHPTMKPVKLIARHIKNSSRIGDTVFDPFGGSGTTLITCEQLDRRCLTMELDPKYCDVILTRWETLTWQNAKLQ